MIDIDTVIDFSSLTLEEIDKVLLKVQTARKRIVKDKTKSIYPDVKKVFEKHKDLFCSTYITKNMKVKLIPYVHSQIKAGIEMPYEDIENSQEYEEYHQKVSKALDEIETDDLYTERLVLLNELITEYELKKYD